MVVATLDGAPSPAVVDKGVHRLLEHPLFVADDNLGGFQGSQPLQTVVSVDNPAVQVVEVAGCEAAAVQLDHGPQFRRQYGKYGHDHVRHPVTAVSEGFHHSQSFDGLFPALARGGMHLVNQLFSQGL